MEEHWTAELELAGVAAVEAGHAVMRHFGGAMDVELKAPDQPLTASDLEADRILRARLLDAFPAYGWLSEETADDPARLRRARVWIVDPIDGTRSFIAGRREFAISVGLAERSEAVAGVVLNPATGELFLTWRGGGAWKLDDALDRPALPALPSGAGDRSGSGPWVRLRPGPPAAVERWILASRGEIREGEFQSFQGWSVRPLGSTTYKLARLAEGGADAFLSRGPKSEWDLCAGALLVQEAGGEVTDLRGEPFRYNRRDPRVYGVLAARRELHPELLRFIETLPPPARLVYRAADPLHPGFDEEE